MLSSQVPKLTGIQHSVLILSSHVCASEVTTVLHVSHPEVQAGQSVTPLTCSYGYVREDPQRKVETSITQGVDSEWTHCHFSSHSMGQCSKSKSNIKETEIFTIKPL